MAGKKTPFIISEYVRWGDIDLAGIICYGAYIRFFELAETEIFRAAGLPFKEMFDRAERYVGPPVVVTQVVAADGAPTPDLPPLQPHAEVSNASAHPWDGLRPPTPQVRLR